MSLRVVSRYLVQMGIFAGGWNGVIVLIAVVLVVLVVLFVCGLLCEDIVYRWLERCDWCGCAGLILSLRFACARDLAYGESVQAPE